MRNLFLCVWFFVATLSVHAGGLAAKDLTGTNVQTRDYLKSVEIGMQGDAAWRSYSAIPLSTAVYNATTQVISFPVQLVGPYNERMQWFNDNVTSFTATQSITASTGGATISDSSPDFYAGSTGITITVTGNEWSIGDTITVSFPALSDGVLDAATSSQILTFTQ